MDQLHVIVYGTVQGVNFRANMARQAQALGICGWIRNVSDGSVETVCEADRAVLEKFLNILRKGSPGSNVTRIDARWSTAQGTYSGFNIRY